MLHHLICLLRKLYAGQEATVRTRHEQQTGSKLGKEYIKAVYCHPVYLIYMQRTLFKIPGWMNHKLELRLPREMSTTSDMQMTSGRAQRASCWEWKSWLKTQHSENEDHGIWSHHFMANRWGNNGTVTDFIFLGSKITVGGDCSCEIKRRLLLGRKPMINLDSILKSRDITLPTNFHLAKAMVFLVVIYGCENWTIKKAECQRIDAFELWCWRRLLRVSWTARRSNQSILKEINPEYSLQGLMLKL